MSKRAGPCRARVGAGAAILVFLCWVPAASSQTVLWNRDHGGTQQDGAFDVTETADGGFVVTGFNSSQNPSHLKDLNLLRTGADGNLIWSRNFRGPLNVWGSEVLELPDGGFIAAGVYEVSSQTHDSYVVRTDADGNLLWHRLYDAGIGDDDRAHAIALTADGGFVIAGQAWWPEPPFASYDVYIVKCNQLGVPEWSRRYKWATGGNDIALAVAESSDGGFLIGGFTQAGTWDAYVIRTDAIGNVVWQRTYGGDWADEANDMRLTPDGGFVLTGSFISNTETDSDIGLVKADAAGNVEWERVYGGIDADWGQQVGSTGDGGYLVAGHTGSYGMGSWDGYVLRTDPDGALLWTQTFGGASDDRGFAIEQTSDGGVVVAGWAWSFGAGQGDVHLLKIEDGATVDVADGGESALAPAVLSINPNPFSASTRLTFMVPGGRQAMIRIVDVAGREVRTWLGSEAATGAGGLAVTWDGRDGEGRRVAPGTYIGTLVVDGRAVSRKLTVLR